MYDSFYGEKSNCQNMKSQIQMAFPGQFTTYLPIFQYFESIEIKKKNQRIYLSTGKLELSFISLWKLH